MSSITQIYKPYTQILHNGDPNLATRQYKICFCTRTLEKTAGGLTIYVQPPSTSDINNNNTLLILVELTTNGNLAQTGIPVATAGNYKHHFQFVDYDVQGSRTVIFVAVKDLSGTTRKTKVRYEDAEEASDGGDSE